MIYIILVSFLLSLTPTLEDSSIQLDFEFSIEETENNGGFFGFIKDARFTNENEILLLSSNEEVKIYNQEGKFLHSIGGEGRGPGEFLTSFSIIGDKKGNIIAVDFGNTKISIWDKNYQLTSEFLFELGWDLKFESNDEDVFIRKFEPSSAPGSFNPVTIYQLTSDPRGAKPVMKVNQQEGELKHEFFHAFYSKWDVTNTDEIVMTGGMNDWLIYRLDMDGKLVKSFGRKVEQVIRTEEETKERIRRARNSSSKGASMIASASPEKPIFKNIKVDDRNLVWAHRSKIYKASEEIDIYSSDGNFITTITLPPSIDEYRLMDISNEKALFRVTHEDGRHSLRVYEINYNS